MKEAGNKLCVSMILPIYNVKICLSRCLESILSQTMPLDKFEVILVDDGSTDGSDSICDEYSNAYENINVIHKKNGGAASARNAGLLEAKGEYIAFVDPDDYLDADYLKIPYEEAYKTEADIVIFDAIKEYPKDKGAGDRNKNKAVAKNNTTQLLRHSEKVFVTSDPQDIMSMRCQVLYPYMNAHACGEDFFRNIPLAAPWDKLYRKSFLDENDLRFSEELKVLDDMCFNFVAFGKAKKVSYVPVTLYHYQIWDNSITNSYKADRDVKDKEVFDFLLNQIRKESDEVGIVSEKSVTQAYYARVIKSFAISLRLCFFNNNNPMDIKQKKQAVRRLMDENPYKLAFREIRLNNLEWKLKIVAIAGRMKDERLIYLLNKLQNG